MELSITSFLNTPTEVYRIEPSLHELIRQTIDNQILNQAYFAKVKAKQLEVLICTHRGDFEVKKCSKTDRGKYFTFQFWIPYPQLMAAPNSVLAFVDFFFEALHHVFEPYQVPAQLIENTKNEVREEIMADPQKYEYVPSDHDLILEKVVKMFNP
jgi:hypothetical protein